MPLNRTLPTVLARSGQSIPQAAFSCHSARSIRRQRYRISIQVHPFSFPGSSTANLGIHVNGVELEKNSH